MDTLSLAGLFLMGVAYGATACTLSCTPMLVPLMMSGGGSLRLSLRAVALFGAGRLTAYTLIAAAAGAAAALVQDFLRDPFLIRTLTGAAMVITALFLFYRLVVPAPHSPCAARGADTNRWGDLGAFVMGALLSANLCAPVTALAAVASASGSIWHAAAYGLSFGFGTVLVASLFFGLFLAPVTREMLRQFAAHKKVIEASASTLLLLAGLLVLTGRLQL